MLNAVVIGHGYVGQATAYALGIKDHYSRHDSTVKKEELHKFKYVFICLPTPTIDGKCDTSLIVDYVEAISYKNPDAIFIIRSTIIPGTVKKLSKLTKKIVHVPEFLSEDTWKKDAEWPDIVVIGGDDEVSLKDIEGIYRGRYKGSDFFVTNSVTAETIKYAINSFYALKVVYANEIFDFAGTVGANYETIKEAMYARKWIGKNHLKVWSKGKRGAGGKMFGKGFRIFFC